MLGIHKNKLGPSRFLGEDRFGPQLDSGDINDLLRVIDTNSNGVVEYEEFLATKTPWTTSRCW